VDARQKTQVLLFIGNRKPVFDEHDAGPHQHSLELGRGSEKFFAVRFRAEPHDPLHAGTIVPAAVEQHDFAGRRQMGNVALEIPLRALALGGSRKRHHLAGSRVEPLGHTLDDAALAGGIAALEKHHHLEPLMYHPILQLDELALQPQQLLEIEVTIDRILLRPVGVMG